MSFLEKQGCFLKVMEVILESNILPILSFLLQPNSDHFIVFF